MLSGILDRHPKLKIMFAHGGGAVPGTIGRIQWGYECRPDLVGPDSPKIAPKESIKRLYVDSITHDPHMLKKLLYEVSSPERVALGSDYPFPLGEVSSVAPGSGEVLDVYPGR